MNGFHLYPGPVVLAAAIQWVIGALWFGFFFKKRWVALVGSTGAAKPGSGVFAMLASFVMSIILCAVLANVIAGLGHLLWAGEPTFRVGASIAVICWFGFIAPPMLTQSIHERRPANLFAINAAYWVVALAVSGGVLAMMVK